MAGVAVGTWQALDSLEAWDAQGSQSHQDQDDDYICSWELVEGDPEWAPHPPTTGLPRIKSARLRLKQWAASPPT